MFPRSLTASVCAFDVFLLSGNGFSSGRRLLETNFVPASSPCFWAPTREILSRLLRARLPSSAAERRTF